MDMLALVLVIVALAAGAGLGWFFGSRPVAEWRTRHSERDAEAKALDEKFRAAIADLATMSERAERAASLESDLRAVRLETDALRVRIAEAERDRHNLAEREKLLTEAREALGKEFEALGNKALEGAQARFLERANERFEASEKANAEKIRALLSPVGERLDTYRKQVEELEGALAIGEAGAGESVLRGRQHAFAQCRVTLLRVAPSAIGGSMAGQ